MDFTDSRGGAARRKSRLKAERFFALALQQRSQRKPYPPDGRAALPKAALHLTRQIP